MGLKDRAAIVTGAASGLGEEITRRFVGERAKVLACNQNKDGLEKLVVALSKEWLVVLPIVLDVSNSGEANRVADCTIKSFGRVDFLINNAGISPPKGLS